MPTRPVDARNAFTGARDRAFRAYVSVVVVLGGVVLVAALARLQPGALADLEPAFWMVCGLLLVGELRPLYAAGTRDTAGVVLSTAFVFALLLRYGLPAALLLQVLGAVLSDLLKKKALWRTTFNVGQYTLSWGAAACVLHLAGHRASLAEPVPVTELGLLAVAGGAVAFFVANELLVTRALSLHSGQPMADLLREDAGYELITNGALLALSPVVVLAIDAGVAFVPLLVPSLIAVYAVASVSMESERQASTDALTGLPNRVLLAERTEEALAAGGAVGLVLLDLDRFKEVNDTLGHHVGDRLLQVVADRLATAVRPGDTVARLGGDEFALLLPGVEGVEGARAAAERVRTELAEPIVLEGVLLDVAASAGVAVAPGHGSDVESLLRHADVAMYLSKESGAVEAYDLQRDRNSPSRLGMLGDLRRAIVDGELELHYQPEVSFDDQRCVGVEALVRWRHPERGLVPPDAFVPLAERSGLIHQLTGWVLDTALAQAAQWRADGLELRVSVNVSARDLCGEDLACQVQQLLLRHGVPASDLQLEVTEGSLVSDPARAGATVRALAELGVVLSLDDFGTGWSSLSHLRHLPVRELKVDRSFVQRLDDPRDLAVVRSVVDLGRGLGMRVVAEGVEDALTFHRLAAMGCDVAQGWFLSRAEPVDVITPWLLERRRRIPLQSRTG